VFPSIPDALWGTGGPAALHPAFTFLHRAVASLVVDLAQMEKRSIICSTGKWIK
jgi:hypothetical protein